MLVHRALQVAGYLPLRGDFDVEHDNDAEMILADMEFTGKSIGCDVAPSSSSSRCAPSTNARATDVRRAEGEHATETELKLKVIEIYNAKLDERERRKAFVLERGLLDYKRLLAIERRRPREERDVYDAFRPFARFLTPGEFEELVRGIILEHRLRRRIGQLQEYRRAGVRSLAEAAEFEASRRKREASAANRRGGSGGGTADGRFDDAVSSRAARYSSRGGVGGDGAADGDSGAAAATVSATSSASVALATTAAASTESGARKRRRAPGQSDEDGTLAGGDDTAQAPPAAAAASTFSLAGVPGAERLAPEERRLCEHLQLLPAQYAQIKATLVNVALVRGHVRTTDLNSLLVHVGECDGSGTLDYPLVLMRGTCRQSLRSFLARTCRRRQDQRRVRLCHQCRLGATHRSATMMTRVPLALRDITVRSARVAASLRATLESHDRTTCSSYVPTTHAKRQHLRHVAVHRISLRVVEDDRVVQPECQHQRAS